VLDGTLRGKGGSLCQLTHSMIPSLVTPVCSICHTVPPTFPANLGVTRLTSSPRNGKTLFRQPPQAFRRSNQLKQHQRSTRKSHRTRCWILPKHRLLKTRASGSKGFAPRGQSSLSAQEADIGGHGTAVRGQGCSQHSFTSTKPDIIRGQPSRGAISGRKNHV
jgi:hypothetical protein